MKVTSNPIVFFGTEDFSVDSLSALIEAGFDIRAVVTKADSKKGRGQKLTPPKVKALATKRGIPVWQPSDLQDIVDDIRALQPVTGVLVSFGRIVPKAIIDLFTPAIVNVHPSLLPAYRGPSPIESAIANGDDETGVSIMSLSPSMDAGPVYHQTIFSLSGQETQPQLYKDLAKLGAAQLVKILPDIIDGTLSPREQDDDLATYCHLLKKSDAIIKPEQLTAAQAERSVRAHLAYPKTKTTALGRDIIIAKASVATQKKTPLDLLCRDGAFLSIDELIAPSGRKMTAADFLRGYSDF